MLEPERDPQPDTETFEWGGCHVTLTDPADVLATAASERVELLHGAAFPAPVRQVRFAVDVGEQDGQRVYGMDAEIHTGATGLPWDRFGPSVLGNDPIGLLLSRRVEKGDPWAIRIVDGVGTAAAEAYRLLGRNRAAGDRADATVLEDPELGLRATVTYSGPEAFARSTNGVRVISLHAAVPIAEMSSAHLRAMFCLVLGVVEEVAGAGRNASDPLAGRRYVLSRYPGEGSTVDSAERVDLDQVGGLPDIVAQFRQIAVSFRHPEVMARWGARRPQGILMYGPPGTGKTMLARALANEIGADFREVRTPEILDKWLGASERNIKRIFRDARRYRQPTVLLFDEFDTIISYAGAGGDAASQAVNAVAGVFKQEMNNLIEENPNVIVVATTNFPQRVDESLIRSGRFDIKVAVPLPDESGRMEILAKMIGQLRARHETDGFRMFADDLDAAGLARGTSGMTGADIREVLRRVRLDKAMHEARTGAVTPISQADLVQGIAEVRQAGAAT
ncbi:MAG TPA: ATP-binding protein [Micromonosporaceae bacterium]|nr:ATP-binding protein [Micromonosporaceae bacterium]